MAIGTPTQIGTDLTSANTSHQMTTSVTVPSGAMVFLLYGCGSGDGAVVRSATTDNGPGLTYAEDVKQAGLSVIDWAYIILSAQAPSGMASGTVITTTFTQLVISMLAGYYCTGLATSAAKDISDGSGPTSVTNWDTTATSTTVADTLVIGGALHDGLTTNSPTGSANELDDFQFAGEAWTMATEYKILSAAGSASLTGSWGGAGITTSAFVAYKAPEVAPPSTTEMTLTHTTAPRW